MTVDEAIEEIKDSMHDTQSRRMAIEALQKQIPMKPKWTVDYEQFTSHLVCPTCKESVSRMNNYCSGCLEVGIEGCGQALDWEG